MKKIQILGNYNCAKRSAKGGENKEFGASLVEYGLLIALVALVAVPAVNQLGENIKSDFNFVSNELASTTIPGLPPD